MWVINVVVWFSVGQCENTPVSPPLSHIYTSPVPEVSFKHFGPVLYLFFTCSSSLPGRFGKARTVSASRFGLSSRRRDPRGLALDAPVSAGCEWSWTSHPVCFLWGQPSLPSSPVRSHCCLLCANHYSSLLRTDWSEGSLSDQTADALSRRFLLFATAVVSVSLGHHCFHQLVFPALMSLCLQWCDVYRRFSSSLYSKFTLSLYS